jgi:hypothetical protein
LGHWSYTVAKKSAKPKKRGPKPSERGPMMGRVVMKCHDDYEEWVAEFAASERIPVPSLVDISLTAHAKAKGFRPPPPR